MTEAAPTKTDTTLGFTPRLDVTEAVVRPGLHAIRLDGRLDESALSPTIHTEILRLAPYRNTIHSLRMEGGGVDQERLFELLDGATRPADAGERATLRLAEAYAELQETPRAQLPDLSIDRLIEMHQSLFGFEEEKQPGQTRKGDHAIVDYRSGTVLFQPTPAKRIKQELQALFDWYQASWVMWVPSAVAAVFVAEFHRIQPFEHGTGRLGRLMAVHILKEMGHSNVPLVEMDRVFFETYRDYYRLLGATVDEGGITAWATYYGQCIERAYEEAVRLTDVQAVIDQQRGGAPKEILAWVLTHERWFQRSDLPNPKGRSPATLSNALTELVSQGYLEKEGERRGTRYRLSKQAKQEILDGAIT